MMDFKEQNDIERAYFKQDFTQAAQLIKRIRQSLSDGKEINIDDINLNGIMDFIPSETYIFIYLFQSGNAPIRYGACRKTLKEALDRCVQKLRQKDSFKDFDIKNSDKCRIMIDWIRETRKIDPKNIISNKFNENRFEIGIDGFSIKDNVGKMYFYLPEDAVIESHLTIGDAVNYMLKKTSIADLSNKFSERRSIFIKKCESNWEFSYLKSRAIVSYKDGCLPLYRGNTLWWDFSYDTLINQFLLSADWLVKNIEDDGKFVYYYDCCKDSRIDHEHPTRKPDNLYYNDLRHCGAVIALIRAYSYTKDEKYLKTIKKAFEFSISTLKEYKIYGNRAYYSYYNKKNKLGGDGLMGIAFMQYRIATGDKSYDRYITGLVRHIISRTTPDGEFLAYYIHPSYNKGKPLTNLSDEERKELFSFYYPGEALLALGLFVNHFDGQDELVKRVIQKTRTSMDWIVNERPKYYAELFTALPSDAWLMQAIEEWTDCPDFIKEEHLNFVFNDAKTMMEKMYKRDDSPYIDYEGGYYYDYGDHYFPDGARSEGLIAAYYLAKKTGRKEFADEILEACKHAAVSQFALFNSDESNYSHRNREKSLNSIRFKATRQWVRVDSIQHVACFFIRLFWSENPKTREEYLSLKG